MSKHLTYNQNIEGIFDEPKNLNAFAQELDSQLPDSAERSISQADQDFGRRLDLKHY